MRALVGNTIVEGATQECAGVVWVKLHRKAGCSRQCGPCRANQWIMHRVFIGGGELVGMLARCHVVMCKAAGRHCRRCVIAEQGGLRRRTIPQHGGAIGMCAFIMTAMLPAHKKMTIKRNTVRDQEAVERGS